MNLCRRASRRLLRAAGHDAVHVADRALRAAPDTAILDQARQEVRTIVTQDQDFATLLTASGARSSSVIRLRMRNARAEAHARAILENLGRLETALQEGVIVVLGDSSMRIRRLPVR
jgi:predicted nuclease of predicted toxin-antitoxin system